MTKVLTRFGTESPPQVAQDLLSAFGLRGETHPRILFVSPHDDDAAIGAGMAIKLALEAGAWVDVVIVTDGRMGYHASMVRDSITQTRRHETYLAYRELGVPRECIHWLGFPDGNTWNYIGRRKSKPGDEGVYYGYTGLENAFTAMLRRARPEVILCPSLSDIHPDHKAVNVELLISIFHAISGIWPELGSPIKRPTLFEWPTYMKPSGNPVIGIFGGKELFETKLDSIAQWASQKEIIAQLIEAQRSAGPVEFLWKPELDVYSPSSVEGLFFP